MDVIFQKNNNMNYTKVYILYDTMIKIRWILNDIQKIISEDYAGYIDSQHLNHPDRYTVPNDMSEQEFEETYLS